MFGCAMSINDNDSPSATDFRINSDDVTGPYSMIDDVEFIPVRVSLLLLLYDARQLFDDYYKINVSIEGKTRDLYVRTKCAHVSNIGGFVIFYNIFKMIFTKPCGRLLLSK